jgi:regulator of nucleoside diphosphate kinase
MSAPARKPIHVLRADLDRLRALVDQHLASRDAAAAEQLDAELDRAIPVEVAPPDVVTLDARVAFVDEATGVRREVVLVYPRDADASSGRISVLAPIGAALLGLAVGDDIAWPLPDGRVARLRILSVAQPAQASAAPASA